MHISRKYFSLINKIIVFIFILFIFNNTSFNYYSEIASNSNEKVAYLKFDDGPSKNTPLIFDILKENDINVTFFIISPPYQSRNDDKRYLLWRKQRAME